MSFWNLSSGESATDTGKEFDSGGGDFEVIPKGTSVLAMVSDAAWKNVYQGPEEFVNVKWTIMKPEAFQNRVLWQKLFVDDADPNTPKEKMAAKRDKHKSMLAAIDANAKGKLGKSQGRPDSDDLALALTGAQCVLTLGVWSQERDGQKSEGNWVMKVQPKGSPVSDGPAMAQKSASKPKPAAFHDDLDDDVPF